MRVVVEQARRRRVALWVVAAYEAPRQWALPSGLPISLPRKDLTEDVTLGVHRLVDQVLDGDPAPPELEVLAVPGPAAKVLVDAARDADLLVVGHRGLGGVASVLVGSVGLSCVLHAPCTVTVVREPVPGRDGQ